MPTLRGDAPLVCCVGAVKATLLKNRIEGIMHRGEGSLPLCLFRGELDIVILRDRRSIIDIEVATPVVTTTTRQG